MSKVKEAVFEHIISTPMYIATLFFAFLSGHLWAYIVLVYFTKKERALLTNICGKTILGILWFSFILIPIYLVTYKNLIINQENLIKVMSSVILFSLVTQLIVFIIINLVKRGK